MKLLLVIPETDFLDDSNFVPPLGLLYVAEALRIDFEDVRILGWQRFKAIAGNLESDCVAGLTGTSAHEEYFRQLPQLVFGDIIKLAGGALATVAPGRIRNYGFDVVVQGEIEGIRDEIIEAIINHDEKIIRGHPDFNMDKYQPDFSLVEDEFDLHKRIGIMTSRGCIHNCSFCAKVISKLRFHNIDFIGNQIKNLKQKYNPELFIFYDDNILIGRQRFLDLANHLYGLKIKWRSQARADNVDSEVIWEAKKSGCIQLSFGVESGSQKILDNVNKRIRVEDNTRAIRICRSIGLKTKAFILLGLPGESHKTIEETRNWVLENRPDIVSLYIFYPFEGCDIYQNKSKYDIEFESLDLGYYASKNGYSPCQVRTSGLESNEIIEHRNRLKCDFEKCGIKVY